MGWIRRSAAQRSGPAVVCNSEKRIATLEGRGTTRGKERKANRSLTTAVAFWLLAFGPALLRALSLRALIAHRSSLIIIPAFKCPRPSPRPCFGAAPPCKCPRIPPHSLTHSSLTAQGCLLWYHGQVLVLLAPSLARPSKAAQGSSSSSSSPPLGPLATSRSKECPLHTNAGPDLSHVLCLELVLDGLGRELCLPVPLPVLPGRHLPRDFQAFRARPRQHG